MILGAQSECRAPATLIAFLCSRYRASHGGKRGTRQCYHPSGSKTGLSAIKSFMEGHDVFTADWLWKVTLFLFPVADVIHPSCGNLGLGTRLAVAQDYVHRRGLIAVLHRQTGTQKTGESCMDENSQYMEK